MKICKRGGLHLQIMKDGYIRPCEFLVSPSQAKEYGSLLDNSIYEIYHSSIAGNLRNMICDGKNFEYCRQDVCRNIATKKNDFIVSIDEIPEFPWELNLAYETVCNYKCMSCNFYNNEPEPDWKIEKIENELRKALPYTRKIIANGCGEVFASKSIMKILAEWDPIYSDSECIVELQTNGSLFNKQNWEKIANIARFYLDVEITIHSFDEKTYQLLSGTSLPISNLIDNLKFVKSLRDQGIINNLELATVVQEKNFMQMPEFTRRCIEEFGADKVRIRGFEPWGAMDRDIEWFFNVRNPLHPYYDEYVKVMSDPIFKNPKVLNWMGHSSSLQGEIPSKAYYNILKKWHICSDPVKKLRSYMDNKGILSVALYGISEMTDIFYKIFVDSGIDVKYVIDKYSPLTEWRKIPVIRPIKKDSSVIDSEGIIIMLFNKKEYIKNDLKKLGYEENVIELDDVLE